MANKPNTYTYNPLKVKIALGSHLVTGLAEDSFVSIEPAGDGVTTKVGCDGEVVRSIDPNRSYTIKLSVLQNSPTNAFLEAQAARDQEEGDGDFPFIVRDLLGNEEFTTDAAWVTKRPAWGRGKESTNREWELQCGVGEFLNA